MSCSWEALTTSKCAGEGRWEVGGGEVGGWDACVNESAKKEKHSHSVEEVRPALASLKGLKDKTKDTVHECSSFNTTPYSSFTAWNNQGGQ